MSSIEPLDNVAHAAVKLRPGFGDAFGDAVNLMPLVANEFAAAQGDYPILFRRADDSLQAFAILGFERDRNLFLHQGSWQARYVPAAARRGPFSLARAEGGDPGVLIDTAHPRIAGQGEDGAPLFLDHGGHAPALEAALAALRSLHLGAEQADAMTTLYGELGLVEPADLAVTLHDGRTVKFDGYEVVSAERLVSLGGEALERLNRHGLLGPAFHAAASLSAFGRLIELEATSARS